MLRKNSLISGLIGVDRNWIGQKVSVHERIWRCEKDE